MKITYIPVDPIALANQAKDCADKVSMAQDAADVTKTVATAIRDVQGFREEIKRLPPSDKAGKKALLDKIAATRAAAKVVIDAKGVKIPSVLAMAKSLLDDPVIPPDVPVFPTFLFKRKIKK